MTNEELEEVLEDIVAGKIQTHAEWKDMSIEEAGREVLALNTLGDPATAEEIGEFERRLGRALAPSFKHYLSTVNGWTGFFDDRDEPGDHLVGTASWDDEELLAQWKQWNEIFVTAWYVGGPEPGSLVPGPDFDTSSAGFHPHYFYRIIDGCLPCPPELKAARRFVVDYSEIRDDPQGQDDLMYARYLLIGWGERTAVVLDGATVREDGEMDVVLFQTGTFATPWRYKNFYEFLLMRKEHYGFDGGG